MEEFLDLLKLILIGLGKLILWVLSDGMGDLSVFNGEVWKSLNRDYVFIGLNLACHDSLVGDDDLWWNFHSKDNKRQNDFKLRHALLGTKFWGAYMTDAIKGVYQTDSSKVSVGKNEGVQQMAKLKKELNALGGHPVLIAMGVKAYNVVSRHFAPKFKVIRIMHYANYISKENYRDKVLEALKGC